MPETNAAPSHVTVQRALADSVRHELHEGRDHLVVPVVMIKEGVLNGAFLSREEFGKFPSAWDGRPVPVLHPEQNGQYISANSPRVLEQTIGKVFNTHVDGDKLKAEAWIDIEKAKARGFGPMVNSLESGEQGMEISTGYFNDDVKANGEHNGKPYNVMHVNIRPDHLALLPGEIGACSWEDGCGVRANQSNDGALSRAWNVIAQRLGLSTNCAGDCAGDCHCNGGQTMADKTVADRLQALKANKHIPDDLKAKAEKLATNKKLTPEQMDMLQNLGEDKQQLTMARAFLDAVEANPGEEVAEEDGAATMEEEQRPVANKDGNLTLNQKQLDELIANRVDDGIRRGEVMRKLTANSECAFDAKQLKAMSTDQLETYEQSIRVRDYSGQGGFAANSDAIDNDAQPLTVQRVLTAPISNTEH